MITSLEAAHRSAHLFDDPDTFMAENPARLASGDIALENVQVSAANRRFRDPHNRVGRRLQVGIGAFVEAFLARTVINHGVHGNLNSQYFARSKSSVYEDDRQSLAREAFARLAAPHKFHGSRAHIATRSEAP